MTLIYQQCNKCGVTRTIAESQAVLTGPYCREAECGGKFHTIASELEGDKLSKEKPDLVNHPPRYTSHPSGVECIQITRHMGFNLGNAIKYIWRADEKGSAITDLEKAVWYINDEIKKRKGNDEKKS